MDNMLSLNDKMPKETQIHIANALKELRLSRSLTRETLETMSGVSASSIKRFESTGEISLKSLLNICLSLGVLSRFDGLFDASTKRMTPKELKAKIAAKKPRQRGSK
ncbi:MAG: XRE family transcriptional regulator [Proteobacteria bacterium]|nr:MAG: XRE family transcriptional regulator [Pseudomonadota bacterium]